MQQNAAVWKYVANISQRPERRSRGATHHIDDGLHIHIMSIHNSNASKRKKKNEHTEFLGVELKCAVTYARTELPHKQWQDVWGAEVHQWMLRCFNLKYGRCAVYIETIKADINHIPHKWTYTALVEAGQIWSFKLTIDQTVWSVKKVCLHQVDLKGNYFKLFKTSLSHRQNTGAGWHHYCYHKITERPQRPPLELLAMSMIVWSIALCVSFAFINQSSMLQCHGKQIEEKQVCLESLQIFFLLFFFLPVLSGTVRVGSLSNDFNFPCCASSVATNNKPISSIDRSSSQ